MRLINADALKYELGDTRDGEPIFRPTEFVRMDVIEKAIDEAPTIERPHGKWVDTDGFGEEVYCSECGHMEKKEKFIWSDVNYCYFCGANMREGDEE